MRKTQIKLTISIVFLLLFIEGVLLIFSLRVKEAELADLNASIASIIENKYNLRGVEIFSSETREEMLRKYSTNIILLTGVIVLFTSAGFMLAYYLIVGRYLHFVFAANISGYSDLHAGLIPDSLIPNDDIGDMMRTHNTMIHKMIEAENNKNEMTRLVVFKEVGVAYNHEVNNVLAIAYGYMDALKKIVPDDAILLKLERVFRRLEVIGRQFKERTKYESTAYSRNTKMAKFE